MKEKLFQLGSHTLFCGREIPLQEKCHSCNVTLSNPIKVSENVIFVTFQGVFKDYISCDKQCLFCGHFYRYQTCIHGIRNYDDRFFMGIDACLFLREHIQNHSSVTSFVKSYNTPFNCNLVHQSVLNGYLLFNALCEQEKGFFLLCFDSMLFLSMVISSNFSVGILKAIFLFKSLMNSEG